MLDMIVAHDKNFAIGKGNTLPWKCPADMAFFRKTSKVYTYLIMGRKTVESLPNQTLPDRLIYTLSRTNPDFDKTVITSIDEAVLLAEKRHFLVAGGDSVYRLMLPYCTNLFVTVLDIEVKGADTFFPEEYLNTFSLKGVIEEGISNDIPYRILRYQNHVQK